MNSQLREQAVKLRTEKNLSYSEIKKRLDVPKSTLSYWLRKLQKSSFSYRESYRHGTCSIYTFGKEKKRELMAAIQAFLNLYGKTIIKGV